MKQKIDTYLNVTSNGANNPFIGAFNIDTYGYSPEIFHSYMLAMYNHVPVYSDYTVLRNQIQLHFTANAERYIKLKKVSDIMENDDPRDEMNYHDTTVYSGNDDTHKSVTTKDRGSDTTTNNTTVTDKVNQYNDSTLKTSGETSTTGNGSVTYGKDTDTEETGGIEYGKRVERTIIGHKTPPAKLIKEYADLIGDSLFNVIIRDVVSTISTSYYSRPYPPTESEE